MIKNQIISERDDRTYEAEASVIIPSRKKAIH